MGHSFSLKTLKFVLNSLFFFSGDFETLKKFLVDCRKIWGKIVKNEKWQGWQGEGGGICYIYDIVRGSGSIILDGIQHGKKESTKFIFQRTYEVYVPKINRPC